MRKRRLNVHCYTNHSISPPPWESRYYKLPARHDGEYNPGRNGSWTILIHEPDFKACTDYPDLLLPGLREALRPKPPRRRPLWTSDPETGTVVQHTAQVGDHELPLVSGSPKVPNIKSGMSGERRPVSAG
jgi:hypothetical protein